MDDDLQHLISQEEKTRHDALFYSQSPKNGYLSGEQARSLFIRSRLPLSELSKIWKLADITRDNMLDASEFATAMYLIQLRLRGFDIPDKLPPSLTPTKVTVTNIPGITENEIKIYQKTFDWKDHGNTGYLDTETACNIMLSSRLEAHVLANIWDLADIDRDAKFSNSEFAIAVHLLRYCKKGNHLEGSIDVKSALPHELFKDEGEAKKARHTEVQTERRQLWTMKQKLCSEMVGLDQKEVDESIRPELLKVEERLAVLEKEETELRRSLLNLKDKSKRESFKPFDRSFLLKKRLSGSDLFKSDRKAYLGKEESVFEKLFTTEELVDDSEFAKTKECEQEKTYNGVGNDFSSYEPSDIVFTEVIREKKTESSLVNGLESTDGNSGLQDENNQLGYREKDSSRNNKITGRTDELRTEGKKVERNESFSWAAVQRRPVIQQSVTEEVLEMPDRKGDVIDEVVSLEHKNRNSDLDEQLKLLENDTDVNGNSSRHFPEHVSIKTVEQVESSPQDLGSMFNDKPRNHSEKHHGKKLPVGRVLSEEEEKELIESGAMKRVEREIRPRSEPTQEDLLPKYIEERRFMDEERRKRREIEEEKIRQAREEIKRKEEESNVHLSLRKAAMNEAKGKLEKQISETDHILPKAYTQSYPVTRREAEKKVNEKCELPANEQTKQPPEAKPVAAAEKKHQPESVQASKDRDDESRHQFNIPVLRKTTHDDVSKKNNRKSWIELEIEQQKIKDEEMRKEREEIQKDLSNENKREEPVARSSRKNEVPSQLKTYSIPPRNTVPSKGASSANQTIKPKESTVVNALPSSLVDGKIGDAELERKKLEEEEERRLEQIERVRQESQRREAEELVLQRNIREEEIRKKKEFQLRESEKIKKEEYERYEEEKRHAEQRRLKFEVEKIRLEERVIRTMKESQETSGRVRTPSTSSEASQSPRQIVSPTPMPTPTPTPTPSQEEEEPRERRRSVRDAKAMFERPQEEPKVVMRQKRHSVNLDDTATNVKPNRNPNRASFYSDAVVSKDSKTTKALEIIRLDDPISEEKPSRLVLGDIASKRQQYEARNRSADASQPVIPGAKSDKKDSKLPSSVSNNAIQQEMAELARKEEEIRLRREQLIKQSSGDDSLDGIKKNPLPSKIQIKRAAPKPTASQQEPQKKPASGRNPPVRMSFIEMEKEKERQREEALQKEREAIMKEREMMLKQKDSDHPKEAAKKKPASGGWQYR